MYGRTLLPTASVFPTRVSADGEPLYKPGGVTIDWAGFTAASGDVTLADGSVIKDGMKYIRYGQVITRKTSDGKFGPYDPDLTNGQEILTRGRIYIVDQTVLQYGSGTSMLSPANDIIGGVIEGGMVWLARILQSGTASASKALGPTFANLILAFPEMRFCDRDN